jgi:Ca2+-binding RTX toxin-like protein
MLLTSWIRALRQSFSRRRGLNRIRRQTGATSSAAPRKLSAVEILEERSLLTALVLDNATFTSTAATPGVNITNSTLDANNDGISDYDNLVIASSDAPIVVSGSGVGIRINLSNLTGLNHITIENVTVTGGAASQGISVTLNNVGIQSLTVDQTTVTTTNANGIDLNLQNIGTAGGADVTVKDSTVRSTNATGVQVTLGSSTLSTHLSALTVADSTLEGVGVTSTAGAAFQTLIDQTSVRNTRVQDGSANPVARSITYNLTRTTVGDLRVEENPLLRGLSVTTTDSPLKSATIADNTINLTAITTATSGIGINATTTASAVGSAQQSDVTNLLIRTNAITGSLANNNTANGVVVNLTDSNLGSYTNNSAGARITANTISNLSSSTGAAVGIQVSASASAAFVAANDVAGVGNDLPLLLDVFNGNNATGVRSTPAGDLNGITSNTLTSNNGRGLVVSTLANTKFLADVTSNTIDGGNGAATAPNRREGVSMTFTDKPTAAGIDSFNLNFSGNTVNRSAGATVGLTSAGTAVGVTLVNTATGSFVIENNVITNTSDSNGGTPNGLGIALVGTSVAQQATNVLRKSFIQNNFFGIAKDGTAGRNNASGLFVNAQEQSTVQDLQILNNIAANNGRNGIHIQRDDQASFTSVNPEAGQNRAVTISGNQLFGNGNSGIFIDARNGSADLLDFEIHDNSIGLTSTAIGAIAAGTALANTQDGIRLFAQADARVLVDIIENDIEFNTGNGINLQTRNNSNTDKRQVGGTWIKNTISNNTASGINIGGRHGLYDEATGTRSPLYIGQEGTDPTDGKSLGNVFENNGQFALQINVGGTDNGDVGFTNNMVRLNRAGGVSISSNQELLAVKKNSFIANQGIGLDLISTGTVSATVRDNLITAQTNIANGNVGDGVEVTSRGGIMSLLMTNNFIDSNAGRGIDVLNAGDAKLQLQIGDGTAEGRNTIVGNNLEGLYVVNSADPGQSQNVPATTAMSANGSVFNRPDIMLNVDRNTIQDNGIGSGFSSTGLILRVGAVGSDGNTVSTAGQVGSASGAANAGNGRVNSRITNNTFDGNFGDDFYVEPFLSTGPGNTGGQWDTNGFNPAGLERDPLSRLNLVFRANTGNGIDVQNFAAFGNNEPQWKSRSSNGAVANPPGPFGNTSRLRSVTNLRGGFDAATGTDTAAPFAPNFGAQFAYEALGPTTWQVETVFDTSGNNATFPFFNPNAAGASQNNFTDPTGLWSIVGVGAFSFPNVASPSLVTAAISVPADPSAVPVSSIRTDFTEFVTGVDLADFQLLSHTISTTLTSSVPVGSGSIVVTNASVFPATPFDIRLEGETLRVASVVGNTLTLMSPTTAVHNGSANRPLEVAYVVPLVDALNAPLSVIPVASTVDPNNPLAFKSYTIDLSFPTANAGSYELRVLTNDAVTVVRDSLPQVNGLGNTLTPVVDNDGVLQNYTASLRFNVDNVRPVAAITPITPDPRNSAAGIVTVNFTENVSGVDIADFTLSRDGTPVNLGSVTVTQVSPSSYTLNLNQLTGAPGTYTLTLVSTDLVSPIVDTANNLVSNLAGVASQDSWTVDTTLPTAALLPTVAIDTGAVTTPSNVQVGPVRINFSEAVTGVGISDLKLTRTDASGTVSNVVLTGITLFQNTQSQYELDLSTVTGVAGTYTLTVNAVNSGIFDLAGNAFETSFSKTFVLDTTAPVGDIVDVAPDPRQAPVNALNTVFTEAVSGLTIGQYVLAYDDGTSATGGTISNATNAPTIVITSNAHGLINGTKITIYGLQGNTNANGVFTVMGVTAMTPNTFQLFDAAGVNPVAGNGIYTSGGRWARNVNIPASTPLTMETPIRYVANLALVTNNPGSYIVSLLSNAGAVDSAGNALLPATSALADIPNQLRDSVGNPMTAAPAQFNVAGQDIWTYGPDVAPIGTITPLPASIGTNAGMVEVKFSEPLQQISGASPVNLADFELRFNGSVVSLAGVTITQTSATTFLVDLSSVTNNNGNYDFRLVTTDLASPIRDTTGNLLVASVASGIASQITWTKIATDPSVTSIKGIFQGSADSASFDTDPVTQTKLRAVQTLTINFSTPVTFTNGLTDASQYFRLTRQAGTGTGPVLPVSLDGLPITQVTTSQYRINVSALTGADGRYAFTVLAGNLIKSTPGGLSLLNSRTISWTKDGTIHVVPDDANNATNANRNANAVLTDGTDATSLGNEVVRTANGKVTLRAAIQEANALAGDDSIELGVGTYVLTAGGVQEDFAGSGDLDIRENLTIKGKGVGQTIIDASGLTGTQRDRIFQILMGATLNLQGVTLQGGGVLGSEDGGAIRNNGTLILQDAEIKNSSSQDDAGAILNSGTATITRTTIAGNTATATGGAIRNTGTLLLTNSTLSANTSGGNGGGLMNVAGGTATLEGVTISGNTATNGAGGGIRNDGTLRLINDTIAFNRALAAQGGAGISRNGVIMIGNTIVSDNLFTSGALNDLSAGAFMSLGGNLIRTPGAAAGFAAAELNQNPNLQPLASNGGPTQTHAILVNSIAIDRGVVANISAGVTTDQRGAPRRLDGPAVGNSVDSGAIEFGTFFVNTTADTRDVTLNDGLAADGLGNTSLRAAIMEANALLGESAIILDGQVYQLNRVDDITPPIVSSILGVPTAPITTGGVGVVTINFSEAVAGFDLGDITLTRTVGAVVTNIPLPATTFQLTKISDSSYKIENKADIAAGVTNTGLTSLTNTTNGLYTLTVNSVATGIRDANNNALAGPGTVNWVRGTDTFAPTVSITPIVNQPVINAGIATVTFSERVNGVSINNFSLTRNGTAVSLAGVTLANTQDANFNGRTVVTLDLTNVTQLVGNYVLSVSPSVGANVTIKDVANNNLAAAASVNWAKAAFTQIAAVTTPRTGALSTVTLQFSEPVAGVRAEDFTLNYDDGTGLGFQPVTITSPTLATLGTVVATPANGNAATQWTFTFNNNEAARDGQYQLNFNGVTNGNVLVTVAGANFIPTTLAQPFLFQVGEDAALFGDLDVLGGAAGNLQIIGVSKDVTTNSLGVTVNPSIIDGLTNDRLFDTQATSNLTISGVELRNGRVVYERNGGGIRNLGTLTINDSDLLSSFADGNGGGISNGNSLTAGTLVLTGSTLQSNSAGSVTSGSQFGKGGAIFNDNGSVTITDTVISSNSAFTDGGALYNDNITSAAITSATLMSNTARRDGGALYNGDTSVLTILSTTLSNNVADSDNDGDGEGGAIFTESSATLTLNTSILRSNSARAGGALYNDDASLTLDSNLFELNIAKGGLSGALGAGTGVGGAIFNSVGGTLILTNGIFTTNSASDDGGAIQNYGTLGVTGTEFLNNSAGTDTRTGDTDDGRGGAIFNDDGSVILTSVEFNQNQSFGQAGALFNQDAGFVSITLSTFNGNTAVADAGAVYNDNVGQVLIDRSTFSSNVSTGNGGGFFNNSELNSSPQSPASSQLVGNINAAVLTLALLDASQFPSQGGFLIQIGTEILLVTRVTGNTFRVVRGVNGTNPAAHNNSDPVSLVDRPAAAAVITSSTFNQNKAANGGAIFNRGFGALSIQNSTLSANTATVNGGGLANFGSVTLLNDTVYLNDAPAAAGIASNSDGSSPLAQVSLKNTIVAGGTASADLGGFSANFTDGGHNLIEDIGTITTFGVVGAPLNSNLLGDSMTPNSPQLDVLKDNGGPTFTHALLFGSLARDAGDNSGTTVGDQRGFTRIFDGDGNGIATVDIGAFESGFIINSFADTVDENILDGINADRFGVSTLRATIMQANARVGEDTIILSPGTYTLTLGGREEDAAATGDLDVTESTLNIIGSGTDQTFIDGAQIDRLFHVLPGFTLNLSNLTLLRGNASTTDNGGAILNQGTVALRNVQVLDSSAARGGAIFNDTTGTLTVTNSLFRGDTAYLQGGAIFNSGSLELTGSSIGVATQLSANLTNLLTATTVTVADVSQFPATPGFVIRIDSEEMRVTAISGNQFTVTRAVNGVLAAHSQNALVSQGNFANAHGGGLYNLGNALITQDFFVGNVADSRGGAIYNGASAAVNSVDIRQSTFADNFASSRGAALYNEDTLLITNSTISSNDSGTNAAIGNTLTGTVDINNSTVVDNVAYRGGGLANTALGTVTVKNTILANNQSTAIAGIKAPNARGTFTTAGNNFVGNNADSVGFINNVNSDQVGSTTSPFDPVIEGLSDNGGATLTQAPRTGSPAIDAGNNTGAADKDTVDQRGAPRPTNDDSDIGSVERQDIHLKSITPNVMLPEGNSGSTPFAFTLTLNQASVEEVRISYTLQGDTALAGEDFINQGGTVVFAPGTLIQTIVVNVNGDTSPELTEQFFVNLVNPVNVTLDVNRAIGTIVTDDTGFRINDVNKVETDSGTQTYTFTVEVVGALLTTNASVQYIVSSSTGALTSAVSAGAMTVNVNNPNAFPTSGSFTIQIDSEQLLVTSVAGNVFNLAAPATAAHNSGVAVTLIGSSTVSNAAGVLVTDSTVTVASAASFPSNGGFAIQVDNEFMQVTSVGGGGVLTVTRGINGSVAAAHAMGAAVTLVRPNAATGGNVDFIDQAAPITLNFVAGATNPAPQSFNVTVNSDLATEANESFFVHLTGSTLPFEFGKSIGIGTIFNDDLGFNVSNASANEGDPPTTTPMQFNVTQRHLVYTSIGGIPTLANTTATVAAVSGTATVGQDFVALTPAQSTLSFSNGITTQPVTVTINGDLQYEIPNEIFQLQVTGGTINTVADTNVSAQSNNGTGTIVDNDPPPDQYHFYTYLNAGVPTIRVDRISSGLGRVLVQETPQAGAAMITQAGNFGGATLDDLFVVDFNLYDSSSAASFAQYDATGVIDLSHVVGNSNPIPAAGISVNGLTQVGADTLRFQGGTNTFTSVVYNSTDGHSGNVMFADAVLGTGTVTYAGLEPVLDLTRATSRVFNAPAGVVNDNIAVSASGGTISISSSSASPTFERILAFAPLGSLTINGGLGNDTISGSSDLSFLGTLTVNGDDGNDTINFANWMLTSAINGGLGNDTITGGGNIDSIDGGDGDDVISGGAGNDQILGGLGNDNLSGNDGDDTIHGDDINDVIDTGMPLTQNDTIQGNDGVDALFGGFGNDNVDGGAGNETVDGGSGDDLVSGGSGNDVVLGNNGNDTVSGGLGADSVDGGFGDDLMYGNDSISGDGSTDTINGQDGSDIIGYIDTSTGNITFTLTSTMLTVGTETEIIVDADRAFLVAGSGNNMMIATSFTGSVTMNGGGGTDTLLGGSGNDSLIGGAANDTLTGNDGNDTINGGDGNDLITGGLGDDVMTGDVGIDTISGGDGNDSATGGDGNDSITGGIGIDTLDGGNNNDTLFGNDDGDSLLGGAGQDSLDGGNGNDSIDGGDGDDTAFGQAGNDDVRGGAGNDTLQGNDGDDSVNGMDGNDTLDGNLGMDTLFGGSGDDLMISTDGNDQVLGQGGSGDTFTYNGDNTIGDIFTIGAVADPNPGTGRVGIALARLNPGLTFTTVLLGVEVFTLNLNGGNDLVTVSDLAAVNDLTVLNINGGDGNDVIDALQSTSTTVALRAFMGAGNDSVQGGAGNDTIKGEAGNDTLIANDGNDSLLGGDGNDSLNGNSGNDTINGELGDDSIWGGAGTDLLSGSDGKDTILGQGSSDTIDGGIGDDFLDGGYGDSATAGSGNDSIRGGAGNDKIAGRDGMDTLFGDAGNDTITGGDDNDAIDGGDGNDLVSGDNGNDTINGGAGNDFLLGGFDNDRILGGAGNDTCVGEAGNDYVDGQGGTDKVLGGNGQGTNTKAPGDTVLGAASEINELFKILTARPSIFNELNF